jgi:uncharacterized repeat protein (TIGR03803 family)
LGPLSSALYLEIPNSRNDLMIRSKSQFRRASLSFTVFAILLCAASTTAFAQFATLHRFGRAPHDGLQPQGGLIADKAGNLYGTTTGGGTGGNGIVFELSPPATSGPWTETVLYNFSGAQGTGIYPEDNLVFDAAGNLYGTAAYGGGINGTVFQLMPPAISGGAWTFNLLYTFQQGTDGQVPISGLVIDAAGNLYGTTFYGGSCADGTVFELSPPVTQGGAWTETLLHSFRSFCNGKIGSDGGHAYGPLVLAGGSLYGTTWGGGTNGSGVVFKLSPPSTGQTNWHEQVLYTFTGGSDGGYPAAGLTLRGGNLYGTTQYGGNMTCSNGVPGCGVVFELSPPSTQGGSWTETVLYSFVTGSDGSLPSSSVIFDPSGNLYSTTSLGGTGTCDYISDPGCGAVFKLAPPTIQGGAWTETTLHAFTGANSGDQGANVSGLVFGRAQTLYGTTGDTGLPAGDGTIFSIAP